MIKMSKRQTIINMINDKELISYLYENNKSDNLKQAITSRKKSLKKNKLYVAVFGVQGAGKSSFLNALVAQRDILPVEADETTCIPVELHKSINNNEKGIIFYNNGQQENVEVSRKEINKYVNNQYNPENELGVDHIELYIKSSFLREDIVFVDLPGVASLREGNQDTTLEYIDRCTAAVFIIRTLPTIGKFEATLMRLVWPQVSKSFFIQNFWSGESKRELENGKKHNEKILDEIARDININQKVEIIPVQVKDATKAVFSNNQELKYKSNIDEISDILKNSFDNWKREVTMATANWLKSLFIDTRKYFSNISADLKKDTNQAITDIEVKREEFKLEKKELEEKFEQLKNKANSIEDDIKIEMNKFIKKTRKEITKTTMTKIERGIVDGDYLQEIIKDAIKDGQGLIAAELEFKLEDMTEYIMDDFKDILQATINIRNDMAGDLDVERVDEQMKPEKLLSTITGAAGGYAGYLGGAAAVAALVSNPAGWVVIAGSVVGGLVIGILGGSIGKSAQEKIEKKRIRKAKRPAKKALNKAFKNLKKKMQKEIDKYRHNIIKKLDQILSDELKNIDEEYSSRLKILQESKADKNLKLNSVKAKIARLNSAIEKL